MSLSVAATTARPAQRAMNRLFSIVASTARTRWKNGLDIDSTDPDLMHDSTLELC